MGFGQDAITTDAQFSCLGGNCNTMLLQRYGQLCYQAYDMIGTLYI